MEMYIWTAANNLYYNGMGFGVLTCDFCKETLKKYHYEIMYASCYANANKWELRRVIWTPSIEPDNDSTWQCD